MMYCGRGIYYLFFIGILVSKVIFVKESKWKENS